MLKLDHALSSLCTTVISMQRQCWFQELHAGTTAPACCCAFFSTQRACPQHVRHTTLARTSTNISTNDVTVHTPTPRARNLPLLLFLQPEQIKQYVNSVISGLIGNSLEWYDFLIYA